VCVYIYIYIYIYKCTPTAPLQRPASLILSGPRTEQLYPKASTSLPPFSSLPPRPPPTNFEPRDDMPRGGEIVSQYEHQTQDGGRNQNDYTQDVATEWIDILTPIRRFLDHSSLKLPQRLWCPDDMFEALAIIDKSCLLIIDTLPNGCRPKYRVYVPERMVACVTMAEATAAMRPLKVAGCDVRGVLILATTARCSPSDGSRISPATMPWEDGTEAACLSYLIFKPQTCNPLLPLPPTPHTIPHFRYRELNPIPPRLPPPLPPLLLHTTINRFDEHETVDTTHKLWNGLPRNILQTVPHNPLPHLQIAQKIALR
jgi:hypothetical protein